MFRPTDDTTDVRAAPFASRSWRPIGGGSEAARAVQAAGLVAFHDADDYLLELRFDDANRGRADLRPALPLTLRW